jgi:hypothetical protein
MSGADSSQGPGWWQASDGKWYPPEQTPAASPPVPTPPTAPTAPGPAPTAPGPAPAGSSSANEAGFFARLFDVSMKTFITPSIIKVLFILGLIAVSIFSLIILVAGAQADGGVVLILLAPLYWFIGVLYLRVILEVIVVLFRIEENTRGQR